MQRPVVGLAQGPQPPRFPEGYWLVASDGGIFAYGDAGFHGSIPGTRPGRPPVRRAYRTVSNAPIVGMVPSANGGVISWWRRRRRLGLGDAQFAGLCPVSAAAWVRQSRSCRTPRATDTGLSPRPATSTPSATRRTTAPREVRLPVTSAVRRRRWWVLHPLADGEVFAYGDAVARGGPVGSLGPPEQRPEPSSRTPTAGATGWPQPIVSAYSSADSAYLGSMAGNHVNGSIIAAAVSTSH